SRCSSSSTAIRTRAATRAGTRSPPCSSAAPTVRRAPVTMPPASPPWASTSCPSSRSTTASSSPTTAPTAPPAGGRRRSGEGSADMTYSYILALDEQKELLRIARASIKEYLVSGRMPPGAPHRPSLIAPASVFVSIHEGEELRGCIGTTQEATPI